MPDLRTMMGKPLPMANMETGTVSVRVSRQTMANSMTGLEVTATIDGKTRTLTTDAQGRATFTGLPPGAQFKASAVVDGERLETETFSVPAQGGARVLLVADLGSAPAAGAPGAPKPDEGFSIDAMVGTVKANPSLPAGTLEVQLFGAAGQPLPAHEVLLGEVKGGSSHAQQANDIKVHRSRSGDDGVARFEGLPTGEAAAYAAVALIDGVRLATQPFRMEASGGMRGEIRALTASSDPSLLRVDRQSKIVFFVVEDGLQVAESIVVKNVGDKMFDAGPAGIFVPLQKGHVSAQEVPPRATPVEVRAPDGVSIQATLAPGTAAEAHFGFILPAHGDSSFDFSQKMPYGMETPLILIPASTGLTITGEGLKRLRDDRNKQGDVVQLYEMPDIPPGGTLALTVAGIPQSDKTGHRVAGGLAVLLLLGAIFGARRPASIARAEQAKQDLLERREVLFADLVSAEEARRQGKSEAEARRREIVERLEGIYRELADLEARRGPPA